LERAGIEMRDIVGRTLQFMAGAISAQLDALKK
jgi:hypothetical protein